MAKKYLPELAPTARRLWGRSVGEALPWLQGMLVLSDIMSLIEHGVERDQGFTAGGPVFNGFTTGVTGCRPSGTSSGEAPNWVTALRFPDINNQRGCWATHGHWYDYVQRTTSAIFQDWPAGGVASPSENPARVGVDIFEISLMRVDWASDPFVGIPSLEGQYASAEAIERADWDGVTANPWARNQPPLALRTSVPIPWPALNPIEWPMVGFPPTPLPIPYRVLPMLPLDEWQPIATQHEASYGVARVPLERGAAAWSVTDGMALRPKHKLARPGPKMKERKFALRTAGNAARVLFDFVSEVDDFTSALYFAIPGKKLKPTYKWDEKRGRWIKFWPTLQEKAWFIYKHHREMNFRQAVINVVRNEATDRFYGGLGKAAQKGVQRLHRQGYGGSPTTLSVTRRAGNLGPQ